MATVTGRHCALFMLYTTACRTTSYADQLLGISTIKQGPSFSDLIYELYQALPFVMAGTLAVVFVVLGLMYRSILAPIRSLISMCYTLFFVYGLGVMVYQDGILSKLGFFGLQPMGKITWMALASTFSIILGFSLGTPYICLISDTIYIVDSGLSLTM